MIVAENISGEVVVAFRDPSSNATYNGLGVIVQNLSGYFGNNESSLEDYTAIKLNNILNGTERPPYYEITKFGNYSLAGYPAYTIEYADKVSGLENLRASAARALGALGALGAQNRFTENITEAWTVKNDTAYLITSLIDADTGNATMERLMYDDMQKLISSFEFAK